MPQIKGCCHEHDFFKGIEPIIRYEGPETDNPLAYRHYNADESGDGQAAGRPSALRRRLVAFSFAWPGGDPFGGQTFERPWFGDTMDLAKLKADVAFEMFAILGQPFLLLPRCRRAARG
jgi:xylose isomerase